ncbi:MAG: protease modulator HflC [Rickettsiales bacterium]|nr:protease modulator HflC [Rickettsiales bacterium]
MIKYILGILAAIIIIVFFNSFYILTQVEQSVEIRFGKAVDKEVDPGLKLKLPFVDVVVFFDKRILHLNAESKEVIASDRKRLIVDAFAKYRIVNPLLFYQSVRTERSADIRLGSVLESSLRQVLGNVPLNSLLQEGGRSEIMGDIRDIVNDKALSFGLEVLDVRIMRADLPRENSVAIYRRMQTEREREAKEFRAEGEEEAKKIKAKAERERIELLATAKKQAEIIRGEADGKATKIYSNAFGVDPNFFEFYSSMNAYKDSVANEETNIIISPDSRFFKYLNNIYR